jgi:hypothetical protein
VKGAGRKAFRDLTQLPVRGHSCKRETDDDMVKYDALQVNAHEYGLSSRHVNSVSLGSEFLGVQYCTNKMTAFWETALFSLVEVDRRFRAVTASMTPP